MARELIPTTECDCWTRVTTHQLPGTSALQVKPLGSDPWHDLRRVFLNKNAWLMAVNQAVDPCKTREGPLEEEQGVGISCCRERLQGLQRLVRLLDPDTCLSILLAVLHGRTELEQYLHRQGE